jgi:hypothetical protein
MVFHVLNRGVGRRKIFYKDRDYPRGRPRKAEAKGQVK